LQAFTEMATYFAIQNQVHGEVYEFCAHDAAVADATRTQVIQ
jgi:hypothetical protein